YQQRKETIERLFGTAKEYHNLRYTRLRGKSKMEATLGLTLACLNMKKYSKIMAGIVFLVCLKVIISRPIVITIVKEKTSWINIPVCLQSETPSFMIAFFYFFTSPTSSFLRYVLVWHRILFGSRFVCLFLFGRLLV
ncbi:transposase, partial [Streptococcus agalactiae]